MNKYQEAHPEWFDEKGRVQPWVLRELIDYNPETGEMRWKERGKHWFVVCGERGPASWNSRWAGKPVGFAVSSLGYLGMSIFAKYHPASQVCWAIKTGQYVENISYDDCDTRNLSFSNLYEISQSALTHRSNTIGSSIDIMFYGVYKSFNSKSKFFAKYFKKRIGTFHTEEGAALAYNLYVMEHAPNAIKNDIDYDFAEATERAAREKALGIRGSSRFRGVVKRNDRFVARIHINRKQIHLGSYESEQDAADAYDRAALKYLGPTAYLNLAVRPEPELAPACPPVPESVSEAVAAKGGRDDF
ncbi:AP2 domain-containing protein [Mesorhizobium sp. M0254]|uniref:AP2 domain-containing protein n=1 Tax=Mesorhizobium sp. M0254 TaxID=2956927 RepID=UPI00333BB0CA